MAALSSFEPSDRHALCVALRDFVLREIFHEEQTDIVATGAAVRAWARETTVEGLAVFTEFLVAGASQAPPIEVEVEMLKGICGRLVAARQFDRTPLMPLENAIWEIVDDYLRPGLIRRRKVASLVVEAISALFMMQSDRRDELISRIQQLNVGWLPRRVEAVLCRKLECIKELTDSAGQALHAYLGGVISGLSGLGSDASHIGPSDAVVQGVSTDNRAESRQKSSRQNAQIIRTDQSARAVADSSAPETAAETDELGDWFCNAVEILQRIQRPANAADLHHAVLFAETLAFDANLSGALLAELAAFIESNRFSVEAGTNIVVGSAIRKYAMNMSEGDFEGYLHWLRPDATQAIGHVVELELVKAFNWRLSCAIATTDAISTKGLPILVDVCLSYLHQRIILQNNHVSTVLAALSAIAVLEALSGTHGETDRLFRMANKMQLTWFSELLADQLDETIAAIREHSPEVAIRVAERTAGHLAPYKRTPNASV